LSFFYIKLYFPFPEFTFKHPNEKQDAANEIKNEISNQSRKKRKFHFDPLLLIRGFIFFCFNKTLQQTMIDLIGDIHGHADKLVQLLEKLGYSKQNNYYAHPERKVLFVGDYIDRGPQIRETLEIVKQMVENQSAIALMGNHEYNALCFQKEVLGI
jgi:predicted MPP superfamily phosphohydrolase